MPTSNLRSNNAPIINNNFNKSGTSQIQQSGNLELVEVDEALAGQLTGLRGSTGPLMQVFVMQGGINVDGLTTGSTNDDE